MHPDFSRRKNADGHTTGYEFTSQELLELSAVSVPANPEAFARFVQKGFSEEDQARVFAEETPEQIPEAVYRELVSINQEIASIALDVATKAVREAHASIAAVKSGRAASAVVGEVLPAGELSLGELLSTITTRPGTSVRETSEPDGEIVSVDNIEAFERAVGLGSSEASGGDGLTYSWNGSRIWRDPGQLRRE